MISPNVMRQGIGEELWINLPKVQRDRVPRPSKADAVAPCGKVCFKKAIRECAGTLHAVMCATCKGAI